MEPLPVIDRKGWWKGSFPNRRILLANELIWHMHRSCTRFEQLVEIRSPRSSQFNYQTHRKCVTPQNEEPAVRTGDRSWLLKRCNFARCSDTCFKMGRSAMHSKAPICLINHSLWPRREIFAPGSPTFPPDSRFPAASTFPIASCA